MKKDYLSPDDIVFESIPSISLSKSALTLISPIF